MKKSYKEAWHILPRAAIALALAASLASCGGGGGGDTNGGDDVAAPPAPSIIMGQTLASDVGWQPPAGTTPPSGNYVYLDSEAGDPIGQGETRLFVDADAVVRVDSGYGRLAVTLAHPERQWTADFVTPEAIRTGFYGDAVRPLMYSNDRPGMQWTTEWRECPDPAAWFVVDHIEILDGIVQSLDLRFAQRCSDNAPALRGKIHWRLADAGPMPIARAPVDLWQPKSSSLPAEGSYFYVESDEEDYVGRGRKRLFTAKDGLMKVVFIDSIQGQAYSVAVQGGFERWGGQLGGVGGVKLKPGYYPGPQTRPDLLVGAGVMGWYGPDGGCARVNGWMLIDRVSYVDEQMVELEMSFEQRCDRSPAALRGKLRWSLLEFLPPPAPTQPVPGDVWHAPAAAVPVSGDFVYLESDADDPVGQGRTLLMTASDAILEGAPHLGALTVQARRDDADAGGTFTPMAGVVAPTTGLYTGLPRAYTPAAGALDWRIDGRSCASSESWVAVDDVNFAADGTVASVRLRFQQHCAGAAGTLRGQVRWSAPSSAVAVLQPAPSALWRAPGNRLPASGNFLYLESDLGDVLTGGRTDLIAGTGDALRLRWQAPTPGGTPGSATLMAWNERGDWHGGLELPPGAAEIATGLYGNLRSTSIEPWRGGFYLSGNGWSCYQNSASWVAVDHVAYAAGELTELDMRFEQRCSDTAFGALRGQLHWRAADIAPPPVPSAVPSGLWDAPSTSIPASGNMLYLESEYGEPRLRGEQFQGDANAVDIQFSGLHGVPGNQYVTVYDRETRRHLWFAEIAAPPAMARLEAGFYADARSSDPYNPGPTQAWDTPTYHCNRATGWFVVDRVEYDGDQLSALDLRFEDHCEGDSARLRGKLRWTRP